jgi:hypothetical protein
MLDQNHSFSIGPLGIRGFLQENIKKFPWPKLPSTWNGYVELEKKRSQYQIFAPRADAVICLALALTLFSMIVYPIGSISDGYLLVTAITLPILTIFLIIRKSQLYVYQMDDREVTQPYSYYSVHILIGIAILLFGSLILRLALLLLTSGFEPRSIIVLGAIFLPIISVSLFYRLSLRSPLERWIINRVRASSDVVTLTPDQISKFLRLLVSKQKETSEENYLRTVYQALNLPVDRVTQDLEYVYKSQNLPGSGQFILEYAPRFISLIVSLFNLVNVLNK